jgi:3-oxoacyl-[acyl-carrier protein] reductase
MSEAEAGARRSDELAGKVAIVTGAGRNIGRAIALSLAAAGATVVVAARSSRAQAEETVALIEAAGGRAGLATADVSDEADAERLIGECVNAYGRLDVLVNNAAVRHETPLLKMTYDEWRQVFSASLDSVFLCTRAALPHLIAAGGGAIVNFGGQSAHAVVTERAHVVASKAGVSAFTKAVALEFAEHNVTANCVVPGSINTQRGLPGAPERPASRKIPPLGRLGTVEEVAAVVRLLAGPEGRYITGQTIHVNGGGFMP